MLTLPIKAYWFNKILHGEKLEEYRAITPYYTKRFKNLSTDLCCLLRSGYNKTRPTLKILFNLTTGIGQKVQGAPTEPCYILTIKAKELIHE